MILDPDEDSQVEILPKTKIPRMTFNKLCFDKTIGTIDLG